MFTPRIISETNVVDGIPVLVVAAEDAARAPHVICMHGFYGRKEDSLELGYRLARRSMVCISFDAVHHGERHDGAMVELDRAENCIYPVPSGLDKYLLMHEIIVQNGRDVETLLTHFQTDGRVDVERCGITGMSMGGFATFYTAAGNPAVQAAASIIGIPTFHERWEDVVLESMTYMEWREQMAAAGSRTAANSAFMQTIDPLDRLASFYPKPLFMLNGDLDTDSPKVYSLHLLRHLQPLYAAHPERLRLKIYDGARHEVTPAMMDDVAEWFARALGTQRESA